MKWKSYGYEQVDGGIRITKYEPEAEEDAVSIPSHIDGVPVVEIGEGAFSENGALLFRVEVPSTVCRIGDNAFKMCLNLTELILHDGLEEIGEGALYLTPLTSVVLPDTVSEIAAPWELGSIRFTLSGEHPYFYGDGFCLYRREGNERELLVSLQADDRDSYDVLKGTTLIGANAFSGNETLESVRLPDTVHTIGEAAFEGCQNLYKIELGEGLKEIGANAFGQCIHLRNLHLPAFVETIGESALSDTFGWSDSFLGLEQITVDVDNLNFEADENGLFEIAGSTGRNLVKYFGEGGEYRIPWDVKRILPGAFRRAKFYRCEIPVSVRGVGKNAFKECRNLREIVLGESGTVLYIPQDPQYRKDEVTQLFFEERPEGRYLYDYPGYDALFDTYLNLPDQCGMACCRLKYPVELTEQMEETYRTFLEEKRSGILREIAQKQDMDRLVMLAELGIFNEENIDESIEILSRSGQTKFTAYLLNYQKEHGGEEGFDFSL